MMQYTFSGIACQSC